MSGKKKALFYVFLLSFGFMLGELTLTYYKPEFHFTLPWKKQTTEKNSGDDRTDEQIKEITSAVSPSSKHPASVLGNDAIPDAVELARPAVVNIDIKAYEKNPMSEFFGEDPFFRRFFGDEFQSEPVPREGKGSGVIISKDGLVITNHHVIQNATEINVTMVDGRVFRGKVKGSDRNLDIALVQIKSDKPLPVVHIGDSKKLRLGETVIAIGNPFGFTQTVTAGIVSALGRDIEAEEGKVLVNLIQTDAAINRGNSGGPLINLKGEVIGINTAIFSPTGGSIGIGFAIPISSVKDVLPELIKHGKIVRPWMGVALIPVPKDPEIGKYLGLKDTKGAVIKDVYAGSPADRAGLQRGDVIIEIENVKVTKPEDLIKVVRKNKVHDNVSVLVIRNRQIKLVKVKLAEMPS